MDFLDTIDSNLSKKRSRRVRSWYLYEQFKSLERNQEEAVERSIQDQILQKELSERRARRKLYDQIGLTATESINSVKTHSQHKSRDSKSLSTSREDFFGYTDQENEVVIRETEVAYDPNQDDSLNDDYKTGEETASITEARSEATMIEHFKTTETADVNLDSQLDEDIEQLENLEKITDICDEADVMSISMCSDEFKHISKKDFTVYSQDNGLLMMWSKLVSFALQVIELNYGNCYGDYGSQLMTAVLACDVFRRGINKMCDILQPYVSPIKFDTDPTVNSCKYCHKSVRRKKSQNKNHTKAVQCKIQNKIKPRPKFARKYRSEPWQHFPPTDHASRNKIKNRNSESWGRNQRNPFYNDYLSTKSSSSNCPEFTNRSSRNLYSACGCGPKVIRPVFKLSQYIDNILKEIEEKYD